MMRTMLKCKIHRATVTEAMLHYEGSITIDEALMEASGLVEYEQVHIYNIDNGNRFSTYTINGERDSGVICLNGAAARQVSKGDLIIIANYATYDEKELADFQPTLVYVDAKNRITKVKRKVESEGQRPRVAASR
ncbi:MAG: aspartate 1-decarboxylase [Deltaproteobacteria bacterium]|nr:aspartate 1-decarboxylase [Deltaproteobacteria bacterium]